MQARGCPGLSCISFRRALEIICVARLHMRAYAYICYTLRCGRREAPAPMRRPAASLPSKKKSSKRSNDGSISGKCCMFLP